MSERFVLDASGLKKAYGGKQALDGLDIRVGRGELVVLLGPNGAGKTTLFELLTGLSVADAGAIRIAGCDIRRQRTRALACMGLVFQQPTIDLEMSVRRNLQYHALLHGIPRRKRDMRIRQSLEDVQLAQQANDKVRTLSGGNRRRVELARAVLHRPRILLMDEPTVGLDPESRRSLMRRVNVLRREQGVGVLWATHLVDEAAHADRVVIIHQGRELAALSPEQLLARTATQDLSEAFLALVDGTEAETVREGLA